MPVQILKKNVKICCLHIPLTGECVGLSILRISEKLLQVGLINTYVDTRLSSHYTLQYFNTVPSDLS